MRTRFLTTLGVVAAIAAVGAPAAVAQDEPLPEIHVAVWSGPEADNLRKVVDEYVAETGNPVSVEEIARDGYDQSLRTTVVGGGSDYDVIYMSSDWMPAFIAAEGLAPFDEYIASDAADFLNMDDLQPGVSNLTFDGHVYGFPSEGDTAWLFYRTDLLEAAGLEPPQTMDEMLQAAIALNTPPDRYGLVIGSRTDEAWWDFMHYFWAFGGQLYDPETMEVTVNDEAGVAALTFYSDLLNKEGVVSPDVTTYGYNEILTALQQDNAAMGVEWMAATQTLTDCEQSPLVCDKLAYELVPPAVAGKYGFGGSSWGWAIPASSTAEGSWLQVHRVARRRPGRQVVGTQRWHPFEFGGPVRSRGGGPSAPVQTPGRGHALSSPDPAADDVRPDRAGDAGCCRCRGGRGQDPPASPR